MTHEQREQLRRRAAGIWIPFSRIGATAGVLGILAMGAKLVRAATQIEDQLREVTDTMRSTSAAVSAQSTALTALTGRVITIEAHQQDHERRLSVLEARHP